MVLPTGDCSRIAEIELKRLSPRECRGKAMAADGYPYARYKLTEEVSNSCVE